MSSKDVVPAPGAAALKADSALMPPPPPRPKRKQIVLDEDDWTAKLEAIIERDYFPELGTLQDKVRWLEAVRSGDPEQIRQAQVAIAQRRAIMAGGQPGTTPGRPLFTPGGTVSRADRGGPTPRVPHLTPAHGTSSSYYSDVLEEGLEGVPRVEVPAQSLDAFLAVHTSEDNASFSEILEAENKRRRQKAVDRLMLAGGGSSSVAAVPRIEGGGSGGSNVRPLSITDGRERTEGFGTSGQQPDTIVGWKKQASNALVNSTDATLPYSKKELALMVEGPPKAIAKQNTRFKPFLTGADTPSTSTDTESLPSSSLGGDHAHTRLGQLRQQQQRQQGYDILATPSFEPGVDASPLVTWGDIDATPMRIEAEDLPAGGTLRNNAGSGFHIKQTPQREVRAHKLASKAATSLRKMVSRGGGATPSIAGTPASAAAAARGGGVQKKGLGGKLSEAGRKLASNLLNKHRGGGSIPADKSLRASYTPSRAGGRADTTSTPSTGGWTPANN